MAKKNIPLRKPVGSNSQGNIQVPGGPLVLDLGDFDEMFGPMESDSPKNGPLGEFWTGLKESFSDRTRTKDILRNFLRSAAPDGISNAMGFADEAMSASRDIKDSLERTNASDLQYIAKRAQALLPKLQQYTSEGLYNDISQGLENKIDEYDYTIQSSRDQTPIRRAAAEANQTSEIETALDNIALSSKLNHNRSEKAAQTRHNQVRAETSIRDLLQTKRFDFVAKSMGMAVDSLQRINGYNEQVNYGFQRKGLELQFRSYMGIKELVKLQEANLELTARAMNAVIRNTGMTDFEKNGDKSLTQMGGPGQQPRRQSFVGRAVSGAANKTLSNYLGGYGGEVQNRVTSNLSQQLSMMVMAAKMGEGGPNLWDNKYKMAGNLAGDYAGDFLLNEIIPMLGREARPGITRFSDKKLGGIHNKVGYGLDNIPAFLQEFVNNNQNQHGIKGKIRDVISPFVPQFGLQDRLQNGTFQTIDQPAQFNQMTQRTIVDGIPGYLARMLQELRMIRTGDDSVGREVYDITSGKFAAEKSAQDNIQNKIIPKNAIRSASSTINDALNTMDADGNLSGRARQALAERMLRDASTNRRFDPEAYVKSRGYQKDMPPEVAAELDQFFKGKFEFDEQGGMKDTAKNQQLRQEFSQAFLDIRSISRDPIKEIQRMINSGHTEPLRAIGIIVTEDGVDKINYPRIWDILRSGVTDGNPFAPGGNGFDPYRDDMSGKSGHKDFMGPAYPGAEKAWAMNKMKRFRGKYAPEEQAARDKMAKHLKSMRGRFGKAAEFAQGKMDGFPDQFSEMMEHPYLKNAGDTVRKYSGLVGQNYGNQLSGMYSAGLQGYDKIAGGLPGMFDKTKTDNPDPEKAKITDLASVFNPDQVIIKGVDFSLGDLIDVNTKKVITSPKDITGEVINRLGQTVVTAAEAAAGLISPTGALIVKAMENTTQIVSDAISRHKGTKSGAPGADADESQLDEEAKLNSQDWTLGPGENPVITSRGMLNGEYYDAAGKILNSIKDIAGDVYDKSGNIVLSAKEFANGLWSRRSGTKYRPTKGLARLLRLAGGAGKFAGQSAGSLAWGATKFTAKAALGIASRVFNFFVDNQNAYIPGEAIPVLTRRSVQNGEYFDDQGKVIEDFVDVYSIIYDAHGEPVIAPELYPQLKNFDGTKHALAKNRSIWGKFVMRPIRAMRNAYGRMTKKYYKWLGKTTVKAGSWLGKKTLGGFSKAGGAIFDRMFEKVPDDPQAQATMQATAAGASMANQPVVESLHAILQELKEQTPKKKRKGSWEDQADNKKSKDPSRKEDDEDEVPGKDGLFKRGLKGLAGLLGFGKKGNKGEDEEDDDGFGLDDLADMADIGDAAGNARERRRARKAGRGMKGLGGGGGKGRLARLGGKLASSRVGMMVGRSAVGSIAARGAMMAGTALAGLLSGPVLLGIAAGAVVIGGGYLAYQRHKNISGDFRELRLNQYGIDGSSSMFSMGGDKMKILELETLMEQYTDKSSPTPSFSIASAGGKKILDILGVDVDDERAVMVMARWLDKRFKPIYLAWISGLNKVGKSDIKINEIDDKLPEELKGDFLETIRFPYNNESPYAVTENPFDPDSPLPNNMEAISKMFDELKDKFADAKQKKKEKDAKEGAAKVEGKDGSKTDPAKPAVDPSLPTAGAGAMSAAQKLAAEANKSDVAKSALLKAPGSIAATAATASTMSGTIASLNQRIGNTLTALQAIRMRAYGMQVLNLAEVKAVMALEAVYVKGLTVTEGKVDYTGTVEALLKEAGQLLGKDTAVGSADRPKLYNWLVDRFGPAFRAYYGSAKNAQPAATLTGLESKLKGSEKITVANAVMGALAPNERTIWEIPSIFEVSGNQQDLKLLADEDLKVLQKEAEKEVVGSPTQKSSDQMAGKNAADTGGSFVDKAMSTIKDTWDSTKSTVSSAWNKASDAVGSAVDGAKMAIGIGPDYGGDGKASGGSLSGGGAPGEVLQGNGGKWEAIPYPSESGSIKAAYPTLKAVSGITGVPLDWLLAIAGIESGFRYKVKAGTSSATGWFQFVDGTWDTMYAMCVKKYGLPPDPGKTRVARKDPRINALLGAEYIKQNWEGLKAALKRPISDVDVYMAHFLGLGGAKRFFRADPNALAYKVFKDEYSANMPLFFVDSKPSKPRTISGIYELFKDKIEKFWKTTGKGFRTGNPGDSVSTMTPEPQTPGAEGGSPTSEEDQLKAKLKDDAAKKDGVAADAKSDDGTTPTTEGGQPTPKVSAMASDTAPMPGAPASGGGPTSPNSSVNSMGTSSGADTVDSQRQAQMDIAQSQNARRESEVRKDQQAVSEVNEIQLRQLNAVLEIRDLMKGALEQMSQGRGNGNQNGKDGSSGQSGNNMTPSGIQSRPAVQRPSSVTLR